MESDLERARRALAVVDGEPDLAWIRARVLTRSGSVADGPMPHAVERRWKLPVPIAAALSVIGVLTATWLLPVDPTQQTERPAGATDTVADARAHLARVITAVTETPLAARAIRHTDGETRETISTISPAVTIVRIGDNNTYLRTDTQRGYVWAVAGPDGKPTAWSTSPPTGDSTPTAEEYAAAGGDPNPGAVLRDLASQAEKVAVTQSAQGLPDRALRLRFTTTGGVLVELLVDLRTGLPAEQRTWASAADDGPPRSVTEFTWLPLSAEVPLRVHGKGTAQTRVPLRDLLAE